MAYKIYDNKKKNSLMHVASFTNDEQVIDEQNIDGFDESFSFFRVKMLTTQVWAGFYFILFGWRNSESKVFL